MSYHNKIYTKEVCVAYFCKKIYFKQTLICIMDNI